MPAFNLISPPQLMRLIGTPDAPILLDCCLDADFAEDPRLIPTARRVAYDELAGPSAGLQAQHVVIICQKGRKLSQGGAALLRTYGIRAEALEGGVHAWRDAGLPLIPATHMPTPATGSLWVTRHRPKIDRIACPWLIRRFIDPQARILYVAPSEVAEVAEKYGAVSFDAEGAQFSHHAGGCSFDALLRRFQLDTEPLQRLAKLVRAADLGQLADVPEAAGLLAISVGLSRWHKDDIAQMETAMSLYDALYRWARDGQGEAHRSAFADAL